MRSIKNPVTITFVESISEGITILDDGTIIYNDETNGNSGNGLIPTPAQCATDSPLFLTDFTLVDYFVTINSNAKVLTPTILQTMPGCAIDCTLDESMSGSIIQSDIFNILPKQG